MHHSLLFRRRPEVAKVLSDGEVATAKQSRPGVDHGLGVELRTQRGRARQLDGEIVTPRWGAIRIVVPHDDLEAAQRRSHGLGCRAGRWEARWRRARESVS